MTEGDKVCYVPLFHMQANHVIAVKKSEGGLLIRTNLNQIQLPQSLHSKK